MKKSIKRALIICGVLFGSILGTVLFLDFPTVAPPKFVTHDWIELEKIDRIGKFHSTLGHGFSHQGDDSPYSDKHYYKASYDYLGTDYNVSIFSPVDGVIAQLSMDSHEFPDGTVQGKKMQIISAMKPSIWFIFFHINVTEVKLGQFVKAGDLLGYGDFRFGASIDIAVMRYGQYISWFDIVSDDLFKQYQARGISSRDMMIKTQAQAEASTKMGYTFQNSDPSDWLDLKNTIRIKHLIHTPFNPENLTHYSYIPNLLVDYANRDYSIVQWFHFSSPVSLICPADGQIARFWSPSPNIYNLVINITTFQGVNLTLSILNFTTGTTFTEFSPIAGGTIIGTIETGVGIEMRHMYAEPAFSALELLTSQSYSPWSSRGISKSDQYLLTFEEFLAKKATSSAGYSYELLGTWFIPL
jgi:hypothetical protein